MIEELLFSGGDRKTSTLFNGGIIAEATVAATTNPSSNNNNNSNNTNSEPNLRCPRCDSSNTKFCYYNNYNLTQPRHFCKTCRRYWTKGGALRNVPIGGGCRKNRSSFTSVLPTTAAKSTSAGKSLKAFSAESLLKSAGLYGVGSLDPHESSLHNPNILWSSPHQPAQTSHLLAFLRSTQNPSPSSLISSPPLHNSDQAGLTGINLLHGQTPLSGLDYPTATSTGLCSSFLRNNNYQANSAHHQQRQQQQLGGHDQNSGIQELYQRLKLSTNSGGSGDNKNGDHIHGHVVLVNNVVSAASSPSCTSRPALETTNQSSAMSRGTNDMGLWNIPAAYSWTSDHLPAAANGGCPY